MAKNLANKKANEVKPTSAAINQPEINVKVDRPNALRDRNWGVLFVSFVFLLSLVATLGVMFFTIGTRLDVVPAALLMVLVEAWLMLVLPFYNRLTFWASIIFIFSFLFFAVPFVALNLFPPYNAYAVGFIVVSLVCFLILFRERHLFLGTPNPVK